MPSQADIDHQQSLLRTYRRNLAHLVKQAASFGGEDAAPLHIANSLEDARANISRIKGILRGWGIDVVDGADE
jgi:hypothetical protein